MEGARVTSNSSSLRGRIRLVSVALCVGLAVLVGAAEGRQSLGPLVGSTLSGIVTSVTDGDTVHVKLSNDGRIIVVRLDGIDTPERGEPFSSQSTRATRVMLFERRVQVRGMDVDRYDRLVAKVTTEGRDASLELVKAGLACHFVRYSSDAVLARAQVDAQTHGRGFWAPGATKPACARTAPAASTLRSNGPFHGNRSSRVYHAPSCANYTCRNCTVVFRTEAEAQAAGFRPAGDCLR